MTQISQKRTGPSMSFGGRRSANGFSSITGCLKNTTSRYFTIFFDKLSSNFQADTELEFTKRNKSLFVELPNRETLKVKANFSIDVLSVVRDICYLCEIRYHTEMSLVKTGQQVSLP